MKSLNLMTIGGGEVRRGLPRGGSPRLKVRFGTFPASSTFHNVVRYFLSAQFFSAVHCRASQWSLARVFFSSFHLFFMLPASLEGWKMTFSLFSFILRHFFSCIQLIVTICRTPLREFNLYYLIFHDPFLFKQKFTRRAELLDSVTPWVPNEVDFTHDFIDSVPLNGVLNLLL